MWSSRSESTLIHSLSSRSTICTVAGCWAEHWRKKLTFTGLEELPVSFLFVSEALSEVAHMQSLAQSLQDRDWSAREPERTCSFTLLECLPVLAPDFFIAIGIHLWNFLSWVQWVHNRTEWMTGRTSPSAKIWAVSRFKSLEWLEWLEWLGTYCYRNNYPKRVEDLSCVVGCQGRHDSPGVHALSM